MNPPCKLHRWAQKVNEPFLVQVQWGVIRQKTVLLCKQFQGENISRTRPAPTQGPILHPGLSKWRNPPSIHITSWDPLGVGISVNQGCHIVKLPLLFHQVPDIVTNSNIIYCLYQKYKCCRTIEIKPFYNTLHIIPYPILPYHIKLTHQPLW